MYHGKTRCTEGNNIERYNRMPPERAAARVLALARNQRLEHRGAAAVPHTGERPASARLSVSVIKHAVVSVIRSGDVESAVEGVNE